MVRALIITYYWPPAGGPGVQRWLKFATYLKQNNITPVVYIPQNPSYAIVDKNIEAEVPQGIEIISYPIKEPYRMAQRFSKGSTQQMSKGILPDKNPSLVERFMLFVRGNFFIPDARVAWVKPSIAYLSGYLKENPVDLVITTGPPHSVHLIGLGLKEQIQCKWMADFRDPWTTIGYHKKLKLTAAAARKHKRLEATVLQQADQILVTSPTTAQEFKAITDKPIAVITNGYNLDDAQNTVVALDDSFSIAHIGSFLTKRDPIVLWQVLSELCTEIEDFSTNLKLVFAGHISQKVLESLENNNLSDTVHNLGYVSHSQAIEIQKKSQILLLVEIDSPETKCIIPGKLFEYLMVARPILSIGPKGSDIASILESTNAGSFFDPSQKSELKAYVLQCYKQYKQGNLQVNSKNVAQFSRENLTKQLSLLIKKVVSY